MSKQRSHPVSVLEENITLPTYLPCPPDKNPMFLEKRVYQGSSGSVYPLPFTDRIEETPVDHSWKGVWIENEYLRVLVLPEIGGRIHALQDKTNGYDLIYRQAVIKPALVGLAGPWISGGIEFNWPQHHRPATFLPVTTEIEYGEDGSITMWCSDHDPLQRMKAMHGVCLRPGVAKLELRVRAYNRTPFPQTFLWWANVATRVHEAYQSFFPPDISFVADHAKRAISTFPYCSGRYYGIDYAERAASGVPANEEPRKYRPPASGGNPPVHYSADDLSFYANIPVPTSYMCLDSGEDFFGGYDHREKAGIIHLANHHIAPGKKQWTWGNHEFGYAWDRNLTDPDEQGQYAPYIELMAGVYTDNQPDFSFLQPGETKTWTQYWAPLTEIGVPLHANEHFALALELAGTTVRLGVNAFADAGKVRIRLFHQNTPIKSFSRDLRPGKALNESFPISKDTELTDLSVRIERAGGECRLLWQPKPEPQKEAPEPATEPPAPEAIDSNDELYVTGLHLAQYRHATRPADLYWKEALRRDPGDSRCHTAMAAHQLRRGLLSEAEAHARAAIRRLTLRNPNPADGAAYYLLGQILIHTDRRDEAYDALYKAAWNQQWAGAAHHSLAEIDCRRSDWPAALDHLDRVLRLDTDNLRARNLRVMVLHELGRRDEADTFLSETRALDPLDNWTRLLAGAPQKDDAQSRLDLAHDLARAGFFAQAITLLKDAPHPSVGLPDQSWGAAPLLAYTLAWIHHLASDKNRAVTLYRKAAKLSADHCFPARLEEIAIFEDAIRLNPSDARAPYYLGNLLYDRRRHKEAIRHWECSAELDPNFPTVWRNLGLGYFNILEQPKKARQAYQSACRAAHDDARLIYERDQLYKRLGDPPDRRLRELQKHPELVARRDDLSVELCALLNQTGAPERALDILTSRRFQPWEGGEGQALGQYLRACLLIARRKLTEGEATAAVEQLMAALAPPENLGEARHLQANQSDIFRLLGEARAATGDPARAEAAWNAAATFEGDFQAMQVQEFSELTYESALAWRHLGQEDKATKLLKDLLAHAKSLEKRPAKIDYFSTSLPSMLLFEDDIQTRQTATARFLQAQARLGLGQIRQGRTLLQDVIEIDPNHSLAADLLDQHQSNKQ